MTFNILLPRERILAVFAFYLGSQVLMALVISVHLSFKLVSKLLMAVITLDFFKLVTVDLM